MFYVIARLCPPLALLLAIRPISAVINGRFWLLGLCLLPFAGLGLIPIIGASIHACSTISGDNFRFGGTVGNGKVSKLTAIDVAIELVEAFGAAKAREMIRVMGDSRGNG